MSILNKMFFCVGLLGSTCGVHANFDQIILGTESGVVQEKSIAQYETSLSKFDGSADDSNPYLGKVLHRTFDCNFSPQRDHSIFIKRSREGIELYKERGATRVANTYDVFRTISRYLSGDSYGNGGQPAIAMFTKTRQIFLVYRIYETQDGRSTLLCYYNSDGRVGSGGSGFSERLFSLKGFKKRSGFLISEGSDSGPALDISLIEPAAITSSDAVGNLTQTMGGIQSTVSGLDTISGTAGNASSTDLKWEMNPPHPDNVGVSEGQVAKKVESTGDILSSIMEPVLFGAKIGLGAYMLKETLKPSKKSKDDDYYDYGYGYGMDYGMGMGYGNMMYGNGAIMGNGMGYGNMYGGMGYGMDYGMGMYPNGGMGMYPSGGMGMYPSMGYGQMPYAMSNYPGAMPYAQGSAMYANPMVGDYPGAMPMPVNQFPVDLGSYPGSQPVGYQQSYPQVGYTQTQSTVSYPGMNPVGYDPIQAYVPAGSNMYPVPTNTAPLSASSSAGVNSYGLNMTIPRNDNTFLSLSGN